MLLSLLLARLMTIAALIFAFQNAEPAQVTFLVWQFESSLALVLVVSFAAGLLSGSLLLLPDRVRAGLASASHRRELAGLSRRLTEGPGKLDAAEARGRRVGARGCAQRATDESHNDARRSDAGRRSRLCARRLSGHRPRTYSIGSGNGLTVVAWN